MVNLWEFPMNLNGRNANYQHFNLLIFYGKNTYHRIGRRPWQDGS
jgi:hypothetical protein